MAPPSVPRSSLSQLFHGKSTVIIICDACRGRSSRIETFVDLALPLDVACESPAQGRGGSVTGDPPNQQTAGSSSSRTTGATPFTATTVFSKIYEQYIFYFKADNKIGIADPLTATHRQYFPRSIILNPSKFSAILYQLNSLSLNNFA